MEELLRALDSYMMSGQFQTREYVCRHGVFTMDAGSGEATLSIPDAGGMMDACPRSPEQAEWTERAMKGIEGVEMTWSTAWRILTPEAFRCVDRLLLANGRISFFSAKLEPPPQVAVSAAFSCIGTTAGFTASVELDDFNDMTGRTIYFPELSFETQTPLEKVVLKFHACADPERSKELRTPWAGDLLTGLRPGTAFEFETIRKNSEFKLSIANAAALFRTLAEGKAGRRARAIIVMRHS